MTVVQSRPAAWPAGNEKVDGPAAPGGKRRRGRKRGDTPVAPGPARTGPQPRARTRSSRDTLLPLAGAAAGSTALTWVLFGWLTPMSGVLGFLVVLLALFLAMYGGLLAATEPAIVVRDRLATVLIGLLACIGFAALVLVIVYTVIKGFDALRNWNFYTQDMTSAGPLDPLTVGGIRHALVGTAWTMGIAMVLSVPLGLAASLFLSECRGPVVWLVRTTVNAMTALPDIIAGLFIYIVWILITRHQHSALAAALALAIMITPVIIRTSDVVLRMVAGSLREASLALGASGWRTVWHVVLPTARSGLATATILGAARGIGETAPVLLTSGSSSFTNLNPFSGPNTSLPLVAFEFTRSPIPNMISRGFGAAAFLMLVVVVLFVIGRSVGGKAPGTQTGRQIRAARRASARDSVRFALTERRTARAESAPLGLGILRSSREPAAKKIRRRLPSRETGSRTTSTRAEGLSNGRNK